MQARATYKAAKQIGTQFSRWLNGLYFFPFWPLPSSSHSSSKREMGSLPSTSPISLNFAEFKFLYELIMFHQIKQSISTAKNGTRPTRDFGRSPSLSKTTKAVIRAV